MFSINKSLINVSILGSYINYFVCVYTTHRRRRKKKLYINGIKLFLLLPISSSGGFRRNETEKKHKKKGKINSTNLVSIVRPRTTKFIGILLFEVKDYLYYRC